MTNPFKIHPVELLATWFGAGKAPFMPGTFGTLAALPFAWAIQTLGGSAALFAASILIFLIGVDVSRRYMVQFQSKHDPQEVVIDEVAGVFLLLSYLPHTVMGYVAGFVLFRLFDILKPWPVSLFDRHVMGGLGIMIDDYMAGFYPIAIIFLADLLSRGTSAESYVQGFLNLLLAF